MVRTMVLASEYDTWYTCTYYRISECGCNHLVSTSELTDDDGWGCVRVKHLQYYHGTRLRTDTYYYVLSKQLPDWKRAHLLRYALRTTCVCVCTYHCTRANGIKSCHTFLIRKYVQLYDTMWYTRTGGIQDTSTTMVHTRVRTYVRTYVHVYK